MKRFLITSVIVFSYLAANAQVQEREDRIDDSTKIEEIVIYNQRLQLPSTLKNRNITIIGQEEIKQLPVSSVNELLSYSAGVDIRQRGPFGTQADLSIDGGSFEQNVLLLNGQKISDPQTGHNSLNIPIPLEAIERIEIVRGPSARLYGINSLTGVVNIVTKNPKKDGLFAHVYGGTNFKKDKEDDHGEVFNGRGVQVGGTLLKEKSNHMLFGSHDSGNGYRYNTAYHNNKAFYQGNFVPNENNSIMVLGGYARSSFGANGFYAAPGDKESKEIVSTTMFNISSRHYLSDRFTLMPSVAYRYNFDDYQYFRHNLDVARSRHYSHAITSNLRGEYLADFAKISFGGEMRYEEINSTNIGDHSKTNYGMYAELQREFFDRLDINVGAYVNYNTKYGWEFFPGVDASYTINENWKALFNAGTASRIPSFTDLYLDQRPGNIGNPDLEPEKAYQIELGGKFQKNRLSVEAFAFYRDINDFIDWVRVDVSNPYQPYNAMKNKTKGFNTRANYLIGKGVSKWNIGMSYTYLDPKVENKDSEKLSKYAIESLRNQFVASVNYSYKNFSATLVNRYSERISYKSYWINDIRLNYNVKNYSFYLDAQNIFDTTYIEAGAVPMPGRWFSVGVKFNGL
ncbi:MULTISPECIES: TonB-dependent receptor plug domain-containing protein [Myroides]|uniref:TonB-dependent receptor n=1 Tax=Myroides albus TaxID=2562892 RepID=A0A6I3LKA5_9FLAO|nr:MULTISPECIES: TonB-dependent receptor [Myroides]MTG96931.1 TonB-dependent receptor [Myroides albus]MVX35376.1 TonB-dependent receptor [Myroides sp. LoEW2-1]UVD78318.1 TonB-dependent receptor [Myroides albus]